MLCRVCEIEKSNDDFVSDKNKKSGKVRLCKECKRKLDKISYDKRKVSINLKKKQKISNFRTQYNGLKIGKKCVKCNESRFYLLDFHHNNNDKEFNIGTEAWRTLNINKIKKEVEKCIILCSNCHREFHFLEKEQNLKIEDYIVS